MNHDKVTGAICFVGFISILAYCAEKRTVERKEKKEHERTVVRKRFVHYLTMSGLDEFCSENKTY